MNARRLALIIAAGVLGAFVLVIGFMFSMGDPPPDPSEAPLEVVANDADGESCILNREDVAAGRHEFAVITEGSGAAVELHDETGNAVFRSDNPEGSAVAEGQEGIGALELSEGQYTVVCLYPDGARGETPLVVTTE